ncbi:MAG: DUF885 domain-containing protein [Novosphingobium sp.]|nr:DUF885 domain-containing protein [Novosphingobium sp.]
MAAARLNRRSALSLLAATGASLVLPSCAHSRLPSTSTNDAKSLLEAIAWRLIESDPEQGTSLGIDTGAHGYLRSRLKDRSAGGMERLAIILRNDQRRVEAVDASSLDAATRTSMAVVRSAYQTALDGLALPYGDVAVGGWRNTPYAVIQNVGAYIDAPRFLDADHPIRDLDDVHAYLSRLSAIPGTLRGEVVRIRSAREMGVVPPDFLLDKTIAQMEQTLADARRGGALVGSLTGRMQEALGYIGEYGIHAHTIVTEEIVPALEEQLAELRRQRALATSDPGISARPHGDEFYAWALRAGTTTRLLPGEIHELGLEELAALHARMDPILASLGYTSGTVGDRMTELARDPAFMFATGDPGRAEIVAFIRRRANWIRRQMPRAFRKLVPGNLEVRRLPAAEEPGAPVAYGGPGSIDGTIPGKMWINLRTTALHRTYDLPTLVHHEAIPGHVWQGEYANRLPLIRSVLSFNAFSEGWALYAQQLADELGAYEGDPAGQLGYLQSLAFRACRMVADTGLHAKDWSREQAIDFFVTRNGNKPETMTSEVDRYCSWPGQACGYKMGHSEIIRQRARAEAALNKRYDLRDFDQAIVEGGNVPLDVLSGNVDAYIAAAAG